MATTLPAFTATASSLAGKFLFESILHVFTSNLLFAFARGKDAHEFW